MLSLGRRRTVMWGVGSYSSLRCFSSFFSCTNQFAVGICFYFKYLYRSRSIIDRQIWWVSRRVLLSRSFFTLTGECWSGESADKTYNKDGSSEFCITKEFAQCDTKDKNACCGNKTTTFIYSIQEDYENQQGEYYLFVTICWKLGCNVPSPCPLNLMLVQFLVFVTSIYLFPFEFLLFDISFMDNKTYLYFRDLVLIGLKAGT